LLTAHIAHEHGGVVLRGGLAGILGYDVDHC
jgi:hypothetical protein